MSEQPTNKPSATDWARIDAMSDADIDTSDSPPLDERFFHRARMRFPKRQIATTLHVDEDTLAWFQAQGDDYEQRMNAALRMYAEVHKVSQR